MLNQRVGSDQLDRTFHALAHPVRRAIVEHLAAGPATVSQLAEPHDMSLPAISQHVRVLQRAGLLEQTRDGRLRRCTLAPGPLSDVFGWVVRYRIFWESILDHIQEEVES